MNAVPALLEAMGALKVTGRRGDFGTLTMQEALIPAAEEHYEDVVRNLDRAIGEIARRHGF